jgi:Flp pilus assembly protein TadB
MTEDDMRELSILRRAGWFLTLTSAAAVVCAVLAGTAGNTPLYTLAAVIVVITGLPALTVPTLIENVKGTK